MKTKIVCGGCGKKYAIDTEKIPSGGATIKCPSCNAKIVLKREEPLSANDIIFDKADQSVAIKKEPIADRRKEVSVDSEMKADQREKDVEKKMGDHTKGGAEKLNDKAQKTALAAKGVKSVKVPNIKETISESITIFELLSLYTLIFFAEAHAVMNQVAP